VSSAYAAGNHFKEDSVNVSISRIARLVLCALVVVMMADRNAMAQAPADPNPGAITLTTGIDMPSVYYFRGIRQEVDPKFTLFPYGDGGIALFSGDGPVKSASINFGVWNSLHGGSTGSNGPSKQMHYEEDFYSTFTLGFAKGMSVGTTYTAYTYPNQFAAPVKEVSVKLAQASRIAPYGVVAFELSGQADAGTSKGTYLELGVAPSWPLVRNVTFAIPVKVGLSLKDYYETATGDEKFGFFDLGGLVTVPLTGIPSSFGAWNIHGGVDYLRLGNGTVALGLGTEGKKNQVVVMGGIGMSY
jgi:hypothetical protein